MLDTKVLDTKKAVRSTNMNSILLFTNSTLADPEDVYDGSH